MTIVPSRSWVMYSRDSIWMYECAISHFATAHIDFRPVPYSGHTILSWMTYYIEIFTWYPYRFYFQHRQLCTAIIHCRATSEMHSDSILCFSWMCSYWFRNVFSNYADLHTMHSEPITIWPSLRMLSQHEWSCLAKWMLLETRKIISLYWRNWSISFCWKGQLNSDTLEVCCRLIYFWRADGSIRTILRLHIIKNVWRFRCCFSRYWTHEHRGNKVLVRNWLIISFVYMRIRISSVFFCALASVFLVIIRSQSSRICFIYHSKCIRIVTAPLEVNCSNFGFFSASGCCWWNFEYRVVIFGIG